MTPENERFAAFCSVMTRVEPVIANLATRAGLDQDEVVAQTWIRGWERCGDLSSLPDEITNQRRYLVRIAENLIQDLLRQASSEDRRLAGDGARNDQRALLSLDYELQLGHEEQVSPLYAAAGTIGADPYDQLEARDREAAIEIAIQTLPRRQRIALEDAIDGTPASDTAETLGIKLSATYEHLRRARASLAISLSHAGIAVPPAGTTRRSARTGGRRRRTNRTRRATQAAV